MLIKSRALLSSPAEDGTKRVHNYGGTMCSQPLPEHFWNKVCGPTPRTDTFSLKGRFKMVASESPAPSVNFSSLLLQTYSKNSHFRWAFSVFLTHHCHMKQTNPHMLPCLYFGSHSLCELLQTPTTRLVSSKSSLDLCSVKEKMWYFYSDGIQLSRSSLSSALTVAKLKCWMWKRR